MENKVAVITGGAQGIGKAIAMCLLEQNMAVVIADNDEEAGRETAEACAALGPLKFIPTDVAREGDVRRLADESVKAFGGIDLLVNNAAIARGLPLAKLSLADWNSVLAVNLTGPFLCAKAMAPFLKERRGVIINIASTRAFMSEASSEAYSASKGGLVALTHALAISLGPEIRVNCISPGWIETQAWRKKSARRIPRLSGADHKQHPVGRVGQPEDIAGLVAYLASPGGSFITGADFVVDGGMTRKMIYV
jgi:NAD(P)-dependent dehydrogenase (short-subunit alcohol dehydrogenase family)